MIILTDADGVLENLTQEWIALLNETYGRDVRYEDLREWDMCAAYPGLTRGQVYGMELNEALYDRMKPIEGARECLEKLIAKGHTVYVVTDTPYQIIRPKMDKVIFRYYPFLTWKNMILTSNKHLICGDVLIDDGVHNLLGGSYRKILVSAPYNEEFDAEANGMVRTRGWKDIEKALRDMGVL